MSNLSKKQIWNKMMTKVSKPIYYSGYGEFSNQWYAYTRMDAEADFDFEAIQILTKECTDEERRKLLKFFNKLYIKQPSYDREENIRHNRMKGDTLYSIIDSFDSEEVKIDFIKKHAERDEYNHIPELIASLSSDEKKLELIKTTGFYEASGCSTVVASLSSDEKKVELLDIIEGDFYRDDSEALNKADVIKSLKSDEKKLELMSSIEQPYIKASIIGSLSSDEKKIELLDSLDEKQRIDVILSLDEDDKKIELLDRVSSEDYRDVRKQLIENESLLNRQKYSVEELDSKMIEHLQYRVIKSLSSDDKKIELLNTLSNWNNKAIIVASTNATEIKSEFLSEMPKGQKYGLGRDVLKKSIKADKEGPVEIQNDVSLTEYIDPLLEQCEELETKGLEDHNKEVEKQRRKIEEANEIRALSEQNDEIQRQIKVAKEKIEELTRKAELEKSIAEGQKELAELLDVLAKLEADREID